MIGHIENGSDFGGLFGYLLSEDKGARIIDGNAAGRNAFELTQEFNNCADQRRTTKKPVKHLIIGFAPEDSYVEDKVKARIARRAVKKLGYEKNQYVVVDHHRNDPGHDWNHDHDHIHIAINIINIDGKRINGWQDKRRFEKILKGLEREESLTITAPSSERSSKAPSHGQVQRLKREIKEYESGKRTEIPEIPQMVKLQAAIDAACKDQPDFKTMVGRLQHLKIDVRPTISDKGRKRISYAIGNLKVRGSKLHNGSFPKLIAERRIDFDPYRDKTVMDGASKGEKIIIPQDKQMEWSDIDLIEYLPSAIKEEIKSNCQPPSEKDELADLILNSDPDRMNSYLKDKGLQVVIKPNSLIEIREKTLKEFPIFLGQKCDRKWEIESVMDDEYIKELLENIAKATISPKVNQKHKNRSKKQLMKKKELDFELE